jgi:hypothetical protein
VCSVRGDFSRRYRMLPYQVTGKQRFTMHGHYAVDRELTGQGYEIRTLVVLVRCTKRERDQRPRCGCSVLPNLDDPECSDLVANPCRRDEASVDTVATLQYPRAGCNHGACIILLHYRPATANRHISSVNCVNGRDHAGEAKNIRYFRFSRY